MTKNKKVAIASVSILFTLIAAVLIIRSPSQSKTPAPDPPVLATPIPSAMPSATAQAINPSESHEKVAEVIDFTADTIVGEIPGILQQIKNSWEWLKVFDTKHALILVLVALFVCSILLGGKKKKILLGR